MPDEPLDETLLLEYMNRFFGYGNPSGDFWFIGMEEGGGNTKEEIANRLSAWEEANKAPIVDVAKYHDRIAMSYFFSRHPKLQNVWNKLIRIQMSAEGITPDTEMVRCFQRDNLGRTKSNNCLLELLPLPSPGINVWHYNKWSGLPELQSREKYCTKWKRRREPVLRNLIKKHNPRYVVFYGLGYWDSWKTIAGTELVWLHHGKMDLAKRGTTSFAVVPHPVAHGLTSEDFHGFGRTLRDY